MSGSPRTLYEVLGVEVDVTRAALEHAYLQQKAARQNDSQALWEIERAFVTLSDPNSKRRYDSELETSGTRSDYRTAQLARAAARVASEPNAPPPTPSTRPSRLPRGPLLALLAVIFVAGFWRVTWPLIGWRLVRHPPGTELVQRGNGEPFGRVIAYEADHVFGPGNRQDAYRVLLPGQDERWLTREEVNRIAAPRR